eukprot:Lithocolla_globosa_v1_NODE_1890_length_2271_cov_8.625451.p1 type:complete len:275 gc:universal NODE_1890_length_2271_cov_8.625451:813-1637(+)
MHWWVCDGNRSSGKQHKKVTKVTERLNSVLGLIGSKAFENFEQYDRISKAFEMVSFSETKAVAMSKSQQSHFVHHNTNRLTRVYPKGSRVNSSNYDPSPLWRVGCQLVALNFQTSDVPMQLHRGLFRLNGNCGYVLKPERLRSSNQLFINVALTSKFHVRIISANLEPQDKLYTPFVLVDLFDGTGKTITHHTKVLGKTTQPIWNESFKFGLSSFFGFLRFAVYDFIKGTDSVLLYQTVLVIGQHQFGYRQIPLHTVGGDPVPSVSLFVCLQTE